jgi:hypothetical protein
LHFAPGESLKTFDVTINDDRTVEDDESLTLTLTNLRGAAVLDAPADARLTILDNDEHTSTSNPIDDTQFFVRQHYLDFLNREPDAEGLAFWTNEIESCGADTQCREVKRINVSAAFFLSIEFQQTGYFVERLYKSAYGRMPTLVEFMPDTQETGRGLVVGAEGWTEKVEANKRAFVEQWVARPAFKAAFDGLSNEQFVAKLYANAGVEQGAEGPELVRALSEGRETRAGAVRRVAENEEFARREFNAAFVQMQYFGYLRRDPDQQGFDFWLSKLEQFGGNYVNAEMVKAFISSAEYNQRFGS